MSCVPLAPSTQPAPSCLLPLFLLPPPTPIFPRSEFLGPWASLGPTPGTGPGAVGNGWVWSPAEVLPDG